MKYNFNTSKTDAFVNLFRLTGKSHFENDEIRNFVMASDDDAEIVALMAVEKFNL